jgi:hypothetical protein
MAESGRKSWPKRREKKKKEIIRAIQYRMSEIRVFIVWIGKTMNKILTVGPPLFLVINKIKDL